MNDFQQFCMTIILSLLSASIIAFGFIQAHQEFSLRRKLKEKTIDHQFRQQDKQTDNKFKVDEMNHAEKMAAHKSAIEKQKNDHSLSMAELKLREKELQMKNNAINHSSVKSQTLIPVLMSAEKSLDKDTTQFLRTHLRYDQTQVTSVSSNSSNSDRVENILTDLSNAIQTEEIRPVTAVHLSTRNDNIT